MRNAKTRNEFAAAVKAAKTPELLAFYNEQTGKDTKKFASREKAEAQVIALWIEPAKSEAPATAAAPGSLFGNLPEQHAETPVDTGRRDPKHLLDGRRHEERRDVSHIAEGRRGGDRRAAVSEAQKKPDRQLPKLVKVDGYAAEMMQCPVCLDKTEWSSITAAAVEGKPGSDRNFCHDCGTEFYPGNGRIYKKPNTTGLRSLAIVQTWKNPDTKEKRSERHKVFVNGNEYRSVREAFTKLGLPMNKHIKFRMELKAKGKLDFKHGDNVIAFVAEEI